MKDLQLPRAASFLSIQIRLTSKLVKEVFSDIMKDATGNAELRVVRRKLIVDGKPAVCSCLVFRRETPPSFLLGTRLRDRRYGFALFIEMDDHLAVLRRNAGRPEAKLASHASGVDHDQLSKVFIDTDTVFTRASFGYIGISNHLLRAKIVEALDLEAATSSLGLSRAVPNTMTRTSGEGATHSVTPGTGKVLERGQSAKIKEVVRWCRRVIAEITSSPRASAFLDACARPANFSELGESQPVGILVHVNELDDANDSGKVELAMTGTAEATAHVAYSQVVGPFRASLELSPHPDKEGHWVILGQSHQELGHLRKNKQTYSVLAPGLSAASINEDGVLSNVQKFINEGRHFTVVYADPRFAFFRGHLYRDGGLAQAALVIAKACEGLSSLAAVASEKGQLTTSDTSFAASTVFGVIESKIVPRDWMLACDDLGDELADFVAMSRNGSDPIIMLIHGKHGQLSSGASPLHDVVAQALKNAGRITTAFVPGKLGKWAKTYSLDGVDTDIARLRRGSEVELLERFNEIQQSPHAVRRVAIVVSSLSRAVLEQAAADLADGKDLAASTVQAIWLLSSFVSGCLEVGAQPFIYCRP